VTPSLSPPLPRQPPLSPFCCRQPLPHSANVHPCPQSGCPSTPLDYHHVPLCRVLIISRAPTAHDEGDGYVGHKLSTKSGRRVHHFHSQVSLPRTGPLPSRASSCFGAPKDRTASLLLASFVVDQARSMHTHSVARVPPCMVSVANLEPLPTL